MSRVYDWSVMNDNIKWHLQTPTNILIFSWNVLYVSHIAEGTKAATFKIKNVAAKVETLTMGLLLLDPEICRTVLQSGLSHSADQNLLCIQTFLTAHHCLEIDSLRTGKIIVFDDVYEQAHTMRVTRMAGGIPWLNCQNCWTMAGGRPWIHHTKCWTKDLGSTVFKPQSAQNTQDCLALHLKEPPAEATIPVFPCHLVMIMEDLKRYQYVRL
jgi:hypothetical protein